MEPSGRVGTQIMKICFLIRAMDRGGAEQQLTILACGLQSLGHQVNVLTFYPGGVLEDDLRAGGVTVKCLGKSGRWQVWRTLKSLVTHVRALQPDVLHAYMPTGNILAVLTKPFIGATRVITGIRASDINLSQYDAMTAWSYRVDRFLSRFADAVISNSQAGAATYQHNCSKAVVRVVPNGIDVDRFTPAPDQRTHIRTDWGVGEDAPVIGMVARIDPMKDYESFFEAVRLVQAKRRDIQFVCVANTSAAAGTAAMDRAKDLGISSNLHWVGRYEAMQDAFPGFDALVLTSVCGEGFPNVVAEAMACGVPCVVTDVGDAKLVVGDTGYTVPIRSPGLLAERLLELVGRIEQDPKSVSGAARDRVVACFGIQSLIQQTLNVLKDTVVE
jgi:glycosyltransferase involved in cell wall biosynthesis